jgi:hypothetical protein
MQSVCLKDFVRYFPAVPKEYAQKLYTQPFDPQNILNLFEGWEYDACCGCYIDSTEDRNIVRFDEVSYTINTERFSKPAHTDDFIRDCRQVGVKLLWSEEMADKLWFRSRYYG